MSAHLPTSGQKPTTISTSTAQSATAAVAQSAPAAAAQSATAAAAQSATAAAVQPATAAIGKQALRSIEKIPFCSINAGPRSDKWQERLKEEYRALIAYVSQNQSTHREWFKLEANSDGTQWKGRCWFVHDVVKHVLQLVIDIHPTYPLTPPELRLPELEGKTSKMYSITYLMPNVLLPLGILLPHSSEPWDVLLTYKGGRICLDIHFAPLWQKYAPRFGVAHSLALGLAPWLAAEVPSLAENGIL